ncbi:MAG: hypothetical protein IRZ10_10160 [Thermoflavifilum sp.]|nr:hypothetical protein [Thermoflavifilum sp.]MCL6514771.1 hypothetical protein [Alicyclobacillus sp.]
MTGVFGGYTRWAVVFLIIFVLFFLFVPAYGVGTAAVPAGVAVTSYPHMYADSSPHMMGGMYPHHYESPESP